MKNLSKLPAKLGKFYAQDQSKKWVLLKVFCVLLTFYGLLLVLPFRYFLKAAKEVPPPVKLMSEEYMEKIAWAIRVVCANVPWAFTCLVQALGAQWLLNKHADIQVCIGVKKSEKEDFSAHAWVVSNSRIIIGELTGQSYVPIAEWN